MRTIVQTGNPVLREAAQEIPLAKITSRKIKTLITEMRALLAKEEYGVALAAPQVGESLRLFVVSGRALAKRDAKYNDTDDKDKQELSPADEVFINPTVVKTSRGKKNKHEGCLSVRGKWGMVPRAEKMTLRAFNEKGEPFTRGASGLLAHIFQHEMDHLEGILYTDKALELYDEQNGEHQ